MEPHVRLVMVPGGMTIAEAERILAEHIAWVPWPRERGFFPEGARIRSEWVHHGSSVRMDFIHPDDVPTDPDAELVALIQRTVLDAFHGSGLVDKAARAETAARAALAVVRDHEAQR